LGLLTRVSIYGRELLAYIIGLKHVFTFVDANEPKLALATVDLTV
jgi:hypothetical protein